MGDKQHTGMTAIDLQDDDALRFAVRVLEGSATKDDKAAAIAGLSEIRTRLRQQQQAVSVPANEFPHDEMDAIALHRFKVEQTDSNIWGWCVRAGDGTQELYKGRKSDCEAVARRLTGAFLDGAMLAHDMLAAAPEPPK